MNQLLYRRMTPTLAHWLERYSSDHRDVFNKRVHRICVPLIFFSLLGLLTLPVVRLEGVGGPEGFRLPVSVVVALAVLLFYFRHSPWVGVGMTLASTLCIFVAMQIIMVSPVSPWIVFTGIFVLAWIGQFIGHKHEGRRPSFLTDLVFLLIGPAWILSVLLKKAGLPL